MMAQQICILPDEDWTLKVIDLSAEVVLQDFLRNPYPLTRIESPAHLFEDRKTINQYAAEAFVTQGVLLDLTHKAVGQAIDDEDLEAAEERTGLSLREGEAVLLHTVRNDTGSRTAKAQNHTHVSQNGAEFLEFKRPSIVGIDAPSLDPYGSTKLPAHRVLMKAGILVLEGLCNLDAIVQPRFRLVALPLKLKRSAAPVRVAAFLDD